MLKASFGKSAIGKLAIGVVALSGVTVAHADAGFLNRFSGVGVGPVLKVVPFYGKEGSKTTKEYEHFWKSKVAGIDLNSRTFADWGYVKLQGMGGLLYLGGDKLYNASGAKGKQVVRDDNDDSASTVTPRSEDAVSGLLAHVGPRVVIDVARSLRIFGGLTGGFVIPTSTEHYTNPYGALSGHIGGAYKFAPSWTVEIAGRYILPSSEVVNKVSGLTFGLKYNV